MKRAIFLDRDGTLNVDVGYTHRVEDLQLIDHAAEGLRRLQAQGFALFIVTNQSGIARGLFDEVQMHTFHAALCQQLRSEGVTIAGVYHCPYHPTAGTGVFRRESPLRKPSPGMLLLAAAQHNLDLTSSFAIGDKRSDIAAGRAAGCQTLLVQTGQAGAGEDDLQITPDFVVPDLLGAAEVIEQQQLVRTDISPGNHSTYPARPVLLDKTRRQGDAA